MEETDYDEDTEYDEDAECAEDAEYDIDAYDEHAEYDVYCPFCAATFSSTEVPDWPRSEAFRRAIQVPGCNAHDDDSNIPERERDRYDPDLVYEEITEWLSNAYAIWIDPITKE